MQTLNQGIERQRFISKKPKHAADIIAGDWVDLDDSASILADVAVAVGSEANEPSFPNAAMQAFADIERLLLGVEARHIGQRPSHHPSRWIALGWLRDADKWHIVFGFESFDFDEVEEIASGPVDFVDQQTVQLEAMLLGVGNQFAKGLPFIGFTGGLGDAKHLADRAALHLSVALQGIDLNIERESLAFLLTAADAGQGDKLFHGMAPWVHRDELV